MTPAELAALNPFPGLRPFAPSEADRFFGRRQQIEELAARLAQSTLIAVAGSSGCGKSSLVLAGLLDELARRRACGGEVEWRPVVMRPGNHPIGSLARPLLAALGTTTGEDPTHAASLEGRLRLSSLGLVEAVRFARLPPQVRVLVVVDQFEEIFRFRRMTDPEEAAAFVKLLLHAALEADAPVSVVLTLRSDALGYGSDFRGLPEAISRGQYLVPRLTREQRKEAIVGPVGLRGFGIAPRLVQRVLNDVSDDFDDLPLMQHVLSRTWRRWAEDSGGSRPIDIDDYQAVGTAERALSMHADEAYESLAELGEVAERVFRALTERLGEGADVRRPMDFARLCKVTGRDGARVAQVIERYRRADTLFLLPPPEVPLEKNPVVDISHESLIRNWKRLQRWADAEGQSAQMYRRLADAARLYPNEGGLLRDRLLQFALDWRERDRPNADWAALYGADFDRTMDFLEESRKRRDREALLEKRAAALKRGMALLVVVGLVLFSLVLVWLWRSSVSAERAAEVARNEADGAREESTSRQLALLAKDDLLAGRVGNALLLAVAAMKRPTQEAQDVLRMALDAAPMRFLTGHANVVSSLAFSPDGAYVATASQDGSVLRWNVATGASAGTLRTGSREARRRDTLVVFGADGSMLATPGQDGSALLWAESRGAHGVPLMDAAGGEPFEPTAIAIDPNGRALAMAGVADGMAMVRLLTIDRQGRGSVRDRPLAGERASTLNVSGLAFSPDGTMLAAATSDAGVRLWDAATGRSLQTLRARNFSAVVGLGLSPDRRTLASGHEDGTLILWDLATGRPRVVKRRAHDGQVGAIAFSGEGKLLASGGWDGAVLIWSAATGERIGQSTVRHESAVARLVFGPECNSLASANVDGKNTCGVLASADASGGIILRGTSKGERIGETLRGHHDRVTALAFSRDGRRLGSAGLDKLVLLWDVAPHVVGSSLRRQDLEVGAAPTGVAFSGDGRWLAAGDEGKVVHLWDLAGTAPALRDLGWHDAGVSAVAFTLGRDSPRLASASEDGSVRLWDLKAAGQSPDGPTTPGLGNVEGHEDKVTSLAFSPDGGTLASGGRDNRVMLWDVSARPIRRKLPRLEHPREVMSVAFSADGELLASGARDGSIRLWNAATGKLVSQRPGSHPGVSDAVTSVAFSPDGSLLATGSEGAEGTLRFWQVRGGEISELGAMNAGWVHSVAFSPDGGKLATGNSIGEVRLWNVQTREPIGAPLIGHDKNVYGVAFSPDGAKIASAGIDRKVILWDAAIADWPRQACAIVGKEFSSSVKWPRNVQSAIEGLLGEGKEPCSPT